MVLDDLLVRVTQLDLTECLTLLENVQARIRVLCAYNGSEFRDDIRSPQISSSSLHDSWAHDSWADSRSPTISVDRSARQGRGHLVLNIIMSTMGASCGALPKEFWGLSRTIDFLAPRGFVVSDESYATYCQRLVGPWPYPVMSLRIGREFRGPLTLLAGIEKLTLGSSCRPLEDLPDTLKELEISSKFNHPLTLPPNLRRLSMLRAEEFNQPITLPSSIRHVSLGGRFDQPLLLPPNVESLEFGTFWNSPSDGMYLDGWSDGMFNRPLSLPDSLKKLILSMRYNQPLSFGENVEELYLGSEFNQPITFPPSLKDLTLECTKYDHLLELPQQLRTLRVGRTHADPDTLVGDTPVPQLVFPPSLHRLLYPKV